MSQSPNPGAQLRIGVDACCWANSRGYGRFTRELVRAMVALAPEAEFVCLVDPWTAERFDLRARNVNLVSVPQSAAPTDAASASSRRSVPDMLRFTRAVARERLDVFFSPSVYTYYPLPPRLPAVITIHDAIAERFPELTLPSSRARLFWAAKVKLAVLQARLILTVSDYSAQELTSVLRVPRTRIRVAPEAPAVSYRPSAPAEVVAAAARAGLADGARWFTYVGGFNPHKRVDLLVRAHARLAQEDGESAPHLLLVGSPDKDSFFKNVAAIESEIARAGTGHLVHWLGYVPDEELRHLHSGALAAVLPSESEGFGLPAVEAAACGTTVIATLESPLPHLLAGGGLFIQPGDEDALLDALRQTAHNESARRIHAAIARERASRLSWQRAGALALNALHEALRRTPRQRVHRTARYRAAEIAV